MKKFFFPILALLLMACSTKPEEQTSIDEHLQDSIMVLLKNHMADIGAAGGEVIVMETSTGRVVVHASEGMDTPEANPDTCYSEGMYEPGSLLRGATILACLQSGKVTSETMVNTEGGIYRVNDSLVIKDSNWRKGGHGTINTKEVGTVASNIGCYMLYKEAYDDPSQLGSALKNLHFGEAMNVNGKDIPTCDFTGGEEMTYGYGFRVHPLQMLTFYNAIANDGKMMLPFYSMTDSVVVAESIADKGNVAELQKIMQLCATEGTARELKGDSTKVSAFTSTVQLCQQDEESNGVYRIQLCGYFPNDNPKYTILVTLHKTAPAFGGVHCTPLFLSVKDLLER